MQHNKQIIQLSDHVKNKIRSHQATPYSFSSDELDLSDNTENDNGKIKSLYLSSFVFFCTDSLVSSSPAKLFRRRSSTFTTYQIQQPSESESFFTDKRIDSKQKQQICQDCLHRDKLLQDEHQRLLRAYDENEKLTKQLGSSVVRLHQYQEENSKLKQHLMKLNTHLQEYQVNFNLLKQKMLTEKNNNPKQDTEVDQLRRLRHELQVYNQVIATKRQEEQKQIDYFSYRNWIQRK
jgi:hypothetical protein